MIQHRSLRRHRRSHPRRSFLAEQLEHRHLLAGDLVISEFMAVNESTLQDEDGDFSDWIELTNVSGQTVNLGGYWLSDDANELTGWRLPARELGTNQKLVVFASGKNRDGADGELHTDFRLSAGGEFLGLIAPDGLTIEHAYSPAFPPQAPDVSFGIAPSSVQTTLLEPTATARYQIATVDTFDAQWFAPEYSADDWSTGGQGIGYETGGSETGSMPQAIQALGPLGYWRFEETGAASVALNQGLGGESLNGSYDGGANRSTMGPGSSDLLFGFDDSNSATGFDGLNDAVTTNTSPLNNLGAFTMVGMIRPAQQTADRVGIFGQNDAVEFGFINPTTLQVWTPGGGSVDVNYTFPANTWHHVAVVGTGQGLMVYLDGMLAGQGGTATTSYGSSNSRFNIGGGGIFDPTGNHFRGVIDEVAIFDRALTQAEITGMLGGQTTDDATLTALIATNVQAAMYEQSSSLLVRIPFQVEDPDALTQLLLNVHYDDGFVAYLNGSEIMRANAPGEEDEPLGFDAAALTARGDSLVLAGETIDISDARDALLAGNNLLAIQVLNASADNPDLVMRAGLVGSTLSVDRTEQGYFTTPTPGADNNPTSSNLGPLVREVTHSPHLPTASDTITVSASVTQTLSSIASVELVYRAMYQDEVAVAMVDNGQSGDAIAGDGIYTARIPANRAEAGDMIRWYVRATDTQQAIGRLPRFEVTTGRNQSPQYFGTLVADASISSNLPVLHWWVERESAAGTRTGARASLYFNGEFYDNMFVRQRGGSTASNPVGKTNFKFDFDQEQFRFDPSFPRVEEFNLNSTATDKAYIRQSLSFEAHAQLGVPASISFPMHVQRNGEFYGVFVFIEEPDDEMLERNGLDDNGALYKMYNEFTSASGARKKTRQFENNADLTTFVNDIRRLSGPELHNYLLDNVALPEMLNYLVATVITHQNDNPHKNHFLYRDTEGTGEWMFLPWDHDLTWGSNWVGTSFSDIIYADDDVITEGPVPSHDPAVIHPSHPFINTEGYREWNNHWNRLMDAMLKDPVIRQMYLRRLRSAMDQLMGPPGTTDSYLDQRLNDYLALMPEDAALDKQRWANPRWRWGEDQTFEQAVEILRNEYLEVRREHLYVTHSVDNLAQEDLVVLIPEFSTARYFVPANNNLGITWTARTFNDSQWSVGETGIGFENSPRTFDPLIRTQVKPHEVAAGSTSVFLRVPFQVDNPVAIENLTLRLKYDDAFVAYLNGVEVARENTRNATGIPSFDEGSRSNSNLAAVSFENFDIGQYANLLVTGQNILAIHAINASTTSSDMLMLPELIDGEIFAVEIAGIPHAQVARPAIRFDDANYDVSPQGGNQDQEYLKLDNPTDTAVDVGGWRLRGAIEHTFRPGTIIPAGMSLYVTPDAAAFRARTSGPTGGQGLLVQGGYLGHLSNLGETVHLFATDGTLLDTLDIPATPTIVQQYLRVTEIHYNPLEQGDETEFLELTNISSTQTLDVSGVSFSDGPQEPYVLPAGTMLSPGQSLVIAANPAALQAAYPQAAATRIFGPYLGNLSNAGERIKLDDASGNTIVNFTYSDGALWPQSADGVGASLVLIDVNTPVDQLDKPNRWRGSTVAGGTPTQAAVPNRGVVINELLSAPIAGGAQQIELKNTSSTTMALAGWSLSDSAANLRKFTFGPGTTLAPGAYLVLSQSEVGFSLDDAGSDDLWLVQTDGNGRPLFFGDDVAFGASVPGEPWGRWPDGPGRLMPLIQPTFGTTNAAPRIGNVVISEVQYHPPEPSAAALALDPTITSADLEFVELTNMQDIPVQLDTWRIRGGIDIDFDPGTLMAEGESVVVLRFNPARPENATRLAAFRAHYGITAEIKLLGGYAGQLSNGMDHVLLQRNATDATEPLWVDEVVYDDVAPWPTAADGNGPSLQRLSPTESGNVASSWFAASPTPGSAVFGQVPGDFNQDGSVNAIDIDLLAAAIRSPSPDPAFDLTGDGLVNVADREEMVTGILRTSYGDSNLDRLFNSSDLVKVFQAGKYEDGVAGNAGWAEGDWNGDGDFTTADLVLAFQSGGYVAGASRAALVDQAFASLFSL